MLDDLNFLKISLGFMGWLTVFELHPGRLVITPYLCLLF
jgi:hypothetical protein